MLLATAFPSLHSSSASNTAFFLVLVPSCQFPLAVRDPIFTPSHASYLQHYRVQDRLILQCPFATNRLAVTKSLFPDQEITRSTWRLWPNLLDV